MKLLTHYLEYQLVVCVPILLNPMILTVLTLVVLPIGPLWVLETEP